MSKANKLEFGYDTSNDPSGVFEGIGIFPTEFLTNGELIDVVTYKGKTYLISKITEVFDKSKVNSIDVREILVDFSLMVKALFLPISLKITMPKN